MVQLHQSQHVVYVHGPSSTRACGNGKVCIEMVTISLALLLQIECADTHLHYSFIICI